MASRGKLMGKATFNPVDGSLSEVSWRSPDEGELIESGSETGPSSSAIPWSLVEPDMQDLSPECRKYIRYCEFFSICILALPSHTIQCTSRSGSFQRICGL